MILGIDPDTQATGLALVGEDGLPKVVGLASIEEVGAKGLEAVALMAALLRFKIATAFKGAERCVVEFPQHYGGRAKADPNHLILLAGVAGAAAAAFGSANVVLVPPRKWKGNVPKHIHHARIMDAIEWDPYMFPPEDVRVVGDVPLMRWKEILDAIGLARSVL